MTDAPIAYWHETFWKPSPDERSILCHEFYVQGWRGTKIHLRIRIARNDYKGRECWMLMWYDAYGREGSNHWMPVFGDLANAKAVAEDRVNRYRKFHLAATASAHRKRAAA